MAKGGEQRKKFFLRVDYIKCVSLVVQLSFNVKEDPDYQQMNSTAMITMHFHCVEKSCFNVYFKQHWL